VGAAQEGQRVQDERHGGAAGAAAGGGGPLGARLAVPAVLAFRRGLLVPVPTGSKPVPVLLFAGFGPLPPGPLLPVGPLGSAGAPGRWLVTGGRGAGRQLRVAHRGRPFLFLGGLRGPSYLTRRPDPVQGRDSARRGRTGRVRRAGRADPIRRRPSRTGRRGAARGTPGGRRGPHPARRPPHSAPRNGAQPLTAL